MNISDYITQVTGYSMRQLADKSGIDRSKLQRQFSGFNALTMETLRDIARGTGLDMIDLFTRAELITTEESQSIRQSITLEDLSDEDIAREVLRRMEGGSETLDQPIGQPNVTNLSDRRPTIGEQKQEGFKAANEWTEDVPED